MSRNIIPLNIATRIINPGHVILVSSGQGDSMGITPIAWHMPLSKDPPLMAMVVDKEHYIHKCIMEAKDFAVNIFSREWLGDIVMCGSVSGWESKKSGLTGFVGEPSLKIKSNRLKRSLAVLECSLEEDKYLKDEYDIIKGKIVYAEAEEKSFNERWIFSEGKQPVHHLGEGSFSYPSCEIIDSYETKE